MGIAIKVENLSKAYQLGEFSTGTLSRDIERWWHLLRGKEDPFLKIGETNDRTSIGKSDIVWSLKDIDFEIKQGDAVGIIGRNGAGKSTLLKVLSRVTSPTVGGVKVKGRIASLLEVGTGFHPELTGRENIFLNGAILGMRKHEIKKHFDAIVDFAGVERYIDTPVKRYSSGMYVRLAFAVAAHLDSEILIVDEVLAVGDAEFQKKCLGKMNDVSKSEGRTVLFVSHNMASVLELCTTGIMMKNGKVESIGSINEIVSNYLNHDGNGTKFENLKKRIDKPEIIFCEIDEEELRNNNLSMFFKFSSPYSLRPPIIGVVINNELAQPVFSSNARMHNRGFNFKSSFESASISLFIPNVPLLTGKYTVSCFIGDLEQNHNTYLDILNFNFQAINIDNSKVPDIKYIGSINLSQSQWKILDVL